MSMTTNLNLGEVVRRIFPDADDDKVHYLLWNHTGFPGFWRTGNPERDVLHSLRTLKRTLDHGHQPCEHCNRKATGRCGQVCRGCQRMLKLASRKIQTP